MAVLAVGPALLATYRPDPYVIGAWLFVTGGGFGAAVGAEGTFVIQAAPQEATATAAAINTLARLFGGGIGTQIGTVILLSGRIPGLSYSYFWSYRDAFLVAACVAATGAGIGTFVRTGVERPASG